MTAGGPGSRIRSRLEAPDPRAAATLLSLILLGLSACLAGCQLDSRGSVSARPVTALAATGSRRASSEPTSPMVIPRGTPVAIRLLQAIGSRTVEQQEFFDGELADAVVVDGRTLIPAGGRVRGRVLAAKKSQSPGDPASLSLGLDSIEVAEGEWIYVKTTSLSARRGSHKGHSLIPPAAGAAGAHPSEHADILFPVRSRLVFLMREDQAIDR